VTAGEQEAVTAEAGSAAPQPDQTDVDKTRNI